MTLEQLKALCAIVETGSFRAASEQLYKAQSAVSSAIQALEQELGLGLFDRSGYRAVLTPPGQALYQRARQLLADAGAIEELAAAYKTGAEPELTFAIDAMCPLSRLAPVLRAFMQNYPETQLRLRMEYLGGSVDRLRRGEADLAVAEVWDEQLDQLEAVRLFEGRFLPLVGQGHALLADAPVTAARLRREVQIVIASTRSGGHPDATVLEASPQWIVSDAASKRDLMIQGLGWGFLPEHLVSEDLAAGRLKQLPLTKALYESLVPATDRVRPQQVLLEMWLVRRRKAVVGPRAQWLWEALTEGERD